MTAQRLSASPLQEQWWFVDQWQPNTSASATLVVRLGGAGDPAAVRRMLLELVSRHGALRTTFEPDGDRVHQVVATASHDPLTVTDHPAGCRSEVLRQIVAGQRFDLVTGPLFRARLDMFGDEHLLTLTGHRAVLDLPSLAVLAGEFRTLYAGAPLPEPVGRCVPLDRDAAIRYWTAKLADTPTVELPTDFPRPATMSFQSGRIRTTLTGAALTRLRALLERTGVGMRAAVLAATAVVVSRHTGVDRPILGLAHADSAGVVGPFADTLPVSVDLSPGLSIVDLLAAAQREIDAMSAHTGLSFVEIVERLARPRDPSRHPVFQIGVDVTADFTGLDVVEAVAIDQRLDLWVRGAESPDGLSITIEYASDLFDRRRIEYLAEHVVGVLTSMAATRSVAELDILADDEWHCLRHAWQGPDRPYQKEMVHELFARQVARTPTAVAVEQPDRALSYAELDVAATRMANLLRGKGVGPDTLVAVCLERGIDALVAILGTLKAGGAYVPLDPTYPSQRLHYILRDSTAGVLITREPLLPIFGGPVDVPTVLVDRDHERIAAEPATAPESGVTPENLVYVMYTSGSTGRPKGVRTRHRNLSWYLSWFLDTIPADRFRQVFGSIAFSFDVSAMDIWPPILTGGRVRLTEGLLAVRDIAAEFAGTTLMNLVPSVLAEYLRRHRLPPTVRTITVGGEHLSDQLLGEIFARSDVAEVHHLYGPTETTVFVTAKHLVRDRPETVTIGRPVHSTRVDILDAHGRVTPIGVPGEACVSGPCVADGYLGRPDLTAARFVPNPHAPGDNVVMYRTGDLCRWNFDGEIEFLGRLDSQVKVRGVRIELGEIESTIERHPGVAQAVAAVKEHALGHQELVAYVVPRAGLVVEELHALCQETLPTVMVPTAFIPIDAIPRSPIGKADRSALPDPASVLEARRDADAQPATPVEELLTEIWMDVLDRPTIRTDDNFFRIGGHSLSAIRLTVEIERRTGVKVPVRTLFRNPVLSALATVIERGAPATSDAGTGTSV